MKIERHTAEIAEEIRSRCLAALLGCAPGIVKSAKRISPIRTGLLRRSIQADVDFNNLTLIVGSQVPYAGYVENGTSKMSARPYLRPGLMENKANIRRMFMLAGLKGIGLAETASGLGVEI